MAEEIKVPDIGDFEGVEVIEVLVKAGERVEKEDSLVTLESDKAAMDVPAPFAGTLSEVRVKVGDRVSQGDVIALAARDDQGWTGAGKSKDGPAEEGKATEGRREKSAAKTKKKEEREDRLPSPGAEGTPSRERTSERPAADRASMVSAHAGPSVRKFARELGANLAKVRGTGRKGRITHADVKAYVKSVMLAGTRGGLPAVPEVDFGRFGRIERRPLSRLKRIAGPRLQAAWVNAPHVTQHDEADMTRLEERRRALKPDFEKQGVKLTPLPFLVRAVVLALKEYPDFNSSLDSSGEALVVKRYFHIGFAVDTEQGLVVPVLRNADGKDLPTIARELAELAEKARTGKLRREDIEGGCFSISSLGSLGGTAFTPIVNVPEVAILGVSRASMKPVWNGEKFEPRLMLPLSLSYDHRVIDGAQAVRFTRHVAETIETLRGLQD